ncbi:hypothetical protein PVK06_024337 [Gossypium arboreum]|uniref:Aminotransferase-like plant mobile domain-containing protein n=1 Tax=Gossypium arboreum TaxID=29729 RepID=A0ABR0PDP9_GOSAR|nr:hypothetical protein PVK06_024337 [Gossypium arboreum]
MLLHPCACTMHTPPWRHLLLHDHPVVACCCHSAVNGPYRVLRGRVNSVGFLPNERLMQYLELAGFGFAALIQTFDLRYDLISALVERWRLEIHTFHFPCGECTIILEDVALQVGLTIDGNAITGKSSIFRPTAFCYELLGLLPSEGKLASLRFSRLKENFECLPSTANE